MGGDALDMLVVGCGDVSWVRYHLLDISLVRSLDMFDDLLHAVLAVIGN